MGVLSSIPAVVTVPKYTFSVYCDAQASVFLFLRSGAQSGQTNRLLSFTVDRKDRIVSVDIY